jgi:hypothetical protein
MVAHLVTFSTADEIQRFLTVFTITRVWSLLWARCSHTGSYTFFSQEVSSLQDFPTKQCTHFLYACMSYTPHSRWFDDSKRQVQITNHLRMRYFPAVMSFFVRYILPKNPTKSWAPLPTPFYNVLVILYRGVVSPCPTSKREDHSLSAVLDCLFIIFTAALRVWRPSPCAYCGRAMLEEPCTL